MNLETPRYTCVQLQSNGRKASAVLVVTLAAGCGLLGEYDYAVDETDAGVGSGFGASGGGMGGTGVGGRGVGGVNTDGTVGSDAADAPELAGAAGQPAAGAAGAIGDAGVDDGTGDSDGGCVASQCPACTSGVPCCVAFVDHCGCTSSNICL